MANANRPAGLIPYRSLTGGIPNRLGSYDITSALAQTLCRGDPVLGLGTNGRNISIATAGNALNILGSFAGVKYTASDGSITYSNVWVTGTTLQTGTVAEALVYDDPDQLFQIQITTATGLIATDVGSQANFLYAAGNLTTGASGVMLDQSTLSNSAQRQFQILGLVNAPDNEYGQYAKVLVRINNSQRRAAVGF